MPISMSLRKETGAVIRRADEPYIPAEATFGEGYPLLYGIDGYSNTIFNPRQMRQLLIEVERLLLEGVSGREQISLEAMAEFCREGQKGAHRFLWFVGD